MHRVASVLLCMLLCFGCQQPSLDLGALRKTFADSAKKQNLRITNWERIYDSLEKKSFDSPMTVIQALTQMIQSDHYASEHVSDLNFLQGNIYYRIDSFRQAVKAYSATDPRDMGPKCLAARAGAYLKAQMPDSALSDLNKAVAVNYDYNWNLGNYYEIIGKRDSALAKYTWLYTNDSVTYAFCKERIHALQAKHPRLLTEMIYTDRKRVVMLLK
jgi:tetratricopeptide (TPR) repeat protein